MIICPPQPAAPHLAPPQANPASQPGTVGQRTEWVAEVEAYVAILRRQLEEMRDGEQG